MINFLTIKILLHKNGYTEADVCVRRIEKKKKKKKKKNKKKKKTTTKKKKQKKKKNQQQQQNKQNNTKKCKNSYEIYPEPIIDK